jgi:hypothetical protein
METFSKTELRAKDRLGQTVSALAKLLDRTMNDIQMLESEFEQQIAQTISETEASVERRAAERLHLAVEEAQQSARSSVREALEAQFREETAVAVEAVRKKLAAENAQLEQEISRLRQTGADWEVERARLTTESQRANQLLDQTRQDHSRNLAETDEAAALALERQISTAVDRVRSELTARWNAERAYIVAERNRAQQRLAESSTDYEQQLANSLDILRSKLTDERDELRRELDKTTQQLAQMHSEQNRTREERDHPPVANVETLRAEISRVEDLIQALSEDIENPETELSAVIRKNAERAELESYLRGLRFSIIPL